MSSCAQGLNGQTNCAMPSPSKNAIAIGIGTGVSILGALLLLILLIVWQSKRKRNAMNVVSDDLEDRLEMVAERTDTAWRYTYNDDKDKGEAGGVVQKGVTALAPPAAVHPVPVEPPIPSASAANGDGNADCKERQSESRSADDTEELIGVPVLLGTTDASIRRSSDQHSHHDNSSGSASHHSSHDSRPVDSS